MYVLKFMQVYVELSLVIYHRTKDGYLSCTSSCASHLPNTGNFSTANISSGNSDL